MSISSNRKVKKAAKAVKPKSSDISKLAPLKNIKVKPKDFDEITSSIVSEFDTTTSLSDSQGIWSNIEEPSEVVEDYTADDASEILRYFESNYCLNPHETDCFTFPDEYVLPTHFCKLFGPKRSKIRLSWLSEEDVSLPYFFTKYHLNAHTTDSFTEENEYVGAIRYFERLKGPVIAEEIIYQIKDLNILEEPCRNLLKFLKFSEHLIMLSKSGEEIGELEITGKFTEVGLQQAIEMTIESNGIVQDVVCGMKSTSQVIIPTLKTLTFRHHEFVQTQDEIINNQIEIVKVNDSYELSHTAAINDELQKETKKFTLEEMENFVSDVSSILIQRLFILLSRPNEEYKFVTITPECDLCPIYFKHIPTTRQLICGHIMTVMGVKKEVHFSNDKIFEDHIYCNKAGRILSQFPIGFPVVYRMCELVTYQKAMKEIDQRKKKREFVWIDDLELCSKYQSRKQNLLADYKSYVESNPDLRAILADFMQSVLIHTPHDVIVYAREYFSFFK